MAAKATVDGLDEFRRTLLGLAAELTTEAERVVVATADAAEAAIRSAYPMSSDDVSGMTLREGLRVDFVDAGPYGAAARVRNISPHARMYESGTAARQTAQGYNRGSAPAKHVFVPIAIRKRRAMYQELVALLEQRGATVTGL